MLFGLKKKKNTLEKSENAGCHHFLLLPQCFPKPSLSESQDSYCRLYFVYAANDVYLYVAQANSSKYSITYIQGPYSPTTL